MLATIKQNKISHLHVWLGDVNVSQSGKYNFLSDGKESDLYIQNQSDIESFLDDIDSDVVEMISNGYTVTTEILNDYAELINQ
jgi:ATP-dependent Zn protease